MFGFPGAVGAIDGCLVPISTPLKHADSYVCRKQCHAMALQAVCDWDNKFIDVDVGAFGSDHCGRVLRHSDLHQNIAQEQRVMFPDNGHMLGHSQYPCLEYLMTPFRDDDGHSLTIAQQKFNAKLCSVREVTIERTFGLLFTRFRRLKFVYMRRTELIPLIVMAACILHNICIEHNDEVKMEESCFFNDNLIEDNEMYQYDDLIGIEKRHKLMQYLESKDE